LAIKNVKKWPDRVGFDLIDWLSYFLMYRTKAIKQLIPSTLHNIQSPLLLAYT